MTTKLRQDAAPPEAPRRHDHPLFSRTVHGERLEDPLSWLRERDDPAVLEHLRAENAYTDSVLAGTEALRQTLYDEMVARIEEDDVSVPVRFGGHWYYERRREGKQYAQHCRRAAREGVAPDESFDADVPEEVLLDLDDLRQTEELPYLRLGAFQPSRCGRFLAYSVDTAGHERYEVRVLDLESGRHLPDRLHNASQSLAWGGAQGGSELIYYVIRDDAQRPHRVYRHRLGTDPADDELVWHEEDDRFFVALRRSRSGRYLFVTSGSHTTSEIRLLDADDPEAEIRSLTGRRQGVEFEVDHHPGDADAGVPGRFFLLTNLDAPEFRLVEVSEDDALGEPSAERWRDVVPHDPDIHLERVLVLANHLVLRRRVNGLPSVRVYGLSSGSVGPHADVVFDDEAHDVQIGSHAEFDTRRLRLLHQNPVQPLTTLEIELGDGPPRLGPRQELKVETVPGYDPSLYESHRFVATARDGEEIPVDVVLRRDRSALLGVAEEGDAPGPLLLYGYGAYGHSLEAKFHRNMVNLLDRGWVFALAHVRGGGEMGEHWHEAGRVEHKENTFHDFVATAELLVARGLTSPRQLAIRGGSAGGLLVGAVLNLRPDLFHAAVADVPFVDVLQTMLDPSLPLTVIEFEEWGNPEEDVAAFGRMRGYSPLENVREASYPHVLATAGLHDPRVQYWEPAKWVQVLRRRTHGGRKLLRTHLEAGHGGASGRYESLWQEALRQAFLLAALETERDTETETQRKTQSDTEHDAESPRVGMPQSTHG